MTYWEGIGRAAQLVSLERKLEKKRFVWARAASDMEAARRDLMRSRANANEWIDLNNERTRSQLS